MLVLSRKVGQKVNIGGDVVVRVLEVKRNRVRLGIEGPPAVAIHRSEVIARDQYSDEPCSFDRFENETRALPESMSLAREPSR